MGRGEEQKDTGTDVSGAMELEKTLNEAVDHLKPFWRIKYMLWRYAPTSDSTLYGMGIGVGIVKLVWLLANGKPHSAALLAIFFVPFIASLGFSIFVTRRLRACAELIAKMFAGPVIVTPDYD
jgi:hypothetical protein